MREGTDGQTGPVPGQRTRPDLQPGPVAPQRSAAPLGHAPAFALAIQRNIERVMVQRIAVATPARPGVIGGKATADLRDQRDPMPSVVAEGIDIPPKIARSRAHCRPPAGHCRHSVRRYRIPRAWGPHLARHRHCRAHRPRVAVHAARALLQVADRLCLAYAISAMVRAVGVTSSSSAWPPSNTGRRAAVPLIGGPRPAKCGCLCDRPPAPRR
jgi:hypothetical protein